MFEGLKKKFTNFVEKFSNKEKEEIKESQAAEAQAPAEQVQAEEKKQEIVEEEKPKPKTETVHKHEHAKAEPIQKVEQVKKAEPEVKVVEETHTKKLIEEYKPEPIKHERLKEEKPKEKSKADVRTTTKIKGFFFGQVKITDKDVEPFLEDLKMELLQSDVNFDVAERIIENMRVGLVGKTLGSRDVNAQISSVLKDSIRSILNKGSGVDIINLIKSKKTAGETPFKILFIGPNGAGKTTTMAKIAKMVMNNNFSCVLSASDTFRAAAIEQTVLHAQRLGINAIKGKYGADPASVAFDAIAHAKAHSIDVVLIDSAGRQETNKSLIEELKKIVRIAKPDMKIFIGESIAGNSLLEQVRAINEAVTIDGIILTKLDVDAKGGNTLSILGDTPIPILFFGTGEKYTDIMPYDPDFVVENIFGAG